MCMCLCYSAEITVVLCEASKLDILYEQAEQSPTLCHVIKMGGATSDEEKEKAEKSGIKLYSMTEVEVIVGINHLLLVNYNNLICTT